MQQPITLISTLPKSGTWFLLTFFWCYKEMLNNAEAYARGEFKPDLLGALRDKKINELSCLESMPNLFICHATCPGYPEMGDRHRAKIEQLQFPHSYHWAEKTLRENGHWEPLSPFNNSAARVLYIYRNPLDHFISYFDFSQTHNNDVHRMKLLSNNERVPVKTLHDFVFDFGSLDGFIKHYYPFKRMAEYYPEKVRLMSYEDLVTYPEAMIEKILTFAGVAPVNKLQQNMVKEALALSSKKSLMQIEATLGRAINGEMQPGGKHLQNGTIGKWQGHFSADEINQITVALDEYGICLQDFTLLPPQQKTKIRRRWWQFLLRMTKFNA